MRALLTLALTLGALAASPACAADVELRTIMQATGPRITLGDLFEHAGAAGSAVVATAAPAGGQAVLDAGAVQAAAKRAGLSWANAEGRRRLIVASAEAKALPGARPSRAGAGRRRSPMRATSRPARSSPPPTWCGATRRSPPPTR